MVSYEWEFSCKLLEIRGKKPRTFTRGSRTKRAMKDSVEFQPKLDICFSLACPWNLISWDSKMWKKGHTKWSINELTAFLDGRPVSFISLPFHNKLVVELIARARAVVSWKSLLFTNSKHKSLNIEKSCVHAHQITKTQLNKVCLL